VIAETADKAVRVIGISGSLRAGSSNAALLHSAAELAPAEMRIIVWEGLGTLPHFNPDLDVDEPPPIVRRFRRLLESADGVIISSPEYAHGVPGSLKNALDWLVSAGELVGKPVAIINAAPGGGERAQASLAETLATMNWNVVSGASLLTRKKIADPQLARELRASLDALAAAITSSSATRPPGP
jgi:chromate reductase